MAMRPCALVFSTLWLLAACDAAAPSQVSVEPPDVGAVTAFQHCRAAPRRALSVRERCVIAHYAENCTPAADCMVTCIASPDGVRVGGGCAHVCAPGPNPWSSLPPQPADCDIEVARQIDRTQPKD
jgi:hypothetical protein